MTKPTRRADRTARFLQMTVTELRRLADRAPDIAAELRHMAEQLEDEANELARRKRGDG